MIAFLLGASDNSFNTSRTVLCALILPENIAQMYSMSKFFQVRCIHNLGGAVVISTESWEA